MRRALAAATLLALGAAPRVASAQVGGAIAGTVKDAVTGTPLDRVLVTVPGQQREATTDTAGVFRLREIVPGWRRVRAVLIGYRPVLRDSVLVRAGETVQLDLVLQPTRTVDTLHAIDVTSAPDVVLDPLATATVQRIGSDDLRRLPVSSVEEAIALSAGAVGESFRGGRLGQESFIIDGLEVKNQLDASTGGLGLRIPVDMLTEASLTTNGFSARYGQAISGLINLTTREGGEHWNARTAWETDRFAPATSDLGLDRFVASGDGPLFGNVRFSFAADATGRLDADPVNAPLSQDSLLRVFDPRTARPNLLPHDGGETYDLAGKLKIPVGGHNTLRLFASGSAEQRLLYDPALKYDEQFAPAQRTTASLLAGHWQYASSAAAARSVIADLHVSLFSREFLRGQLDGTPSPAFGGFYGRPFAIAGSGIARGMDTLAALDPIPGYQASSLSERTPWGVPAFFLTGAGSTSLAWNHFGETRAQLDVNWGSGGADFYAGGEISQQHVQTFQRADPGTVVGIKLGAAPPAASDFRPVMAAGYLETQTRWSDLAFTVGVRVDHFDARTTQSVYKSVPQTAVSPRFAVSTVLKDATVVVSWGQFSQPPDFQYLVDAAFDDTLRTGRFRVGNPTLGYEKANQYEFSVRARPWRGYALRVNAYVKRLTGLVASVPFGVNPDSTMFGNFDYGSVKGAEVLLEREYARGFGLRLMGTLQSATATAANAYQFFQRVRVAPNQVDTISPGSIEVPLDYDRRFGGTAVAYGTVPDGWGPRLAGVSVLGGFEGSLIFHVATGLPYSRMTPSGDTIIGLPNSARLPTQYAADVLVRRPIAIGRWRGSVYFDVRNLTNRRNIVAVRRDTGMPTLGDSGIVQQARLAYTFHPEAIPWESPRYRPWADLNHDGMISGESELMPLFVAAARDFYQPLFAYGPPRQMRFGVELLF